MNAKFLSGVILLASIQCGAAESHLPDDDFQPVNNSMGTAHYLGSISEPDNNTPRRITDEGQVGVNYAHRFDTVDFYRFDVPENNWDVHFQLDEKPDLTIGLRILTSDGTVIRPSGAQENEDFNIVLTPGTYFAELFTTREWARGRPLDYTMSIHPKLMVISDPARGFCAGAPRLPGTVGDWHLEGSLQPGPDYYGMLVTSDLFGAFPEGRSEYKISLESPLDTVSVVFSDGRKYGRQYIDPGYYCLKIHKEPLPQQPYNYRFIYQVLAGFPSINGLPLDRVDLGVIARNGQYGTKQRYLNPGPNYDYRLQSGRMYRVAEFLDSGETHRFKIMKADRPVLFAASVGRLMAPVRLSFYSGNGTLLGVSDSRGATSREPGYLPDQRFDGTMLSEDGTIDIKVEQLGGTTLGTPYTLRLTGSFQ